MNNIDLCTARGCQGASSSDNKRSSSDLNTTLSLDQLSKKPKKLFLDSQEIAITTANVSDFLRLLSDPCSTPVANQLVPKSPAENAVCLPLRPPLKRSISDLSPNKSYSRTSRFKSDSATDCEESVTVRELRNASSYISSVLVAKAIRFFSLEETVTTNLCRL